MNTVISYSIQARIWAQPLLGPILEMCVPWLMLYIGVLVILASILVFRETIDGMLKAALIRCLAIFGYDYDYQKWISRRAALYNYRREVADSLDIPSVFAKPVALSVEEFHSEEGLFDHTSYLFDYHLRHELRDNLVYDERINNRNAHPTAAAMRTGAANAICNTVRLAGLRPYSVSCSRSDYDNGIEGDRTHYWIDDLDTPELHDPIEADHAYVLIDVDYYVNLQDYMDGHPILMYTLNPYKPAGKHREGVYYPLSDRLIKCVIGSTRVYEHALWDYDTEYMTSIKHDPDNDEATMLFVYKVDRVCLDPKEDGSRFVIIMTPLRVMTEWNSGFVNPPKRRVFSQLGEFILSTSMRSAEVWVHLARLNHSHCYTIPQSSFIAIRKRIQYSTSPAPSIIERYIRAQFEEGLGSVERVQDMSMELLDYFLQETGADPPKMDIINNVHYPYADPSYTRSLPITLEDGPPSVRVLMQPLITNTGFTPSPTFNNEDWGVKGRVETIRSDVNTIPPRYMNAVVWLANKMTKDYAGSLVPLEPEEVAKYQNKPSHKRDREALKNFFMFDEKFVVQSFIKKEIYSDVKDPRLISMTSSNSKFIWACFVYPIMAWLKSFPFYAFGHDPKTIADQVHERTKPWKFVTLGDFSRWDGRFSNILAKLLLMFYILLFAKPYTTMLRKCYWANFKCRAFTRNGRAYQTLFSILSGKMDTAAGNSLGDIIICFCALVEAGFTYDEAYQRLLMYGGDDSKTGELPPATLIYTAKKFGCVSKAERVNRHGMVTFLGRVYPDPWTSSGSIADLKRQLGKFHLTNSPEECGTSLPLIRKAEAYLVTDPSTPVLSCLCRKVLEDVKCDVGSEHVEQRLQADLYWWDAFSCPFPQVEDQELAWVAASNNLGVPIEQLQAYEAHIKETDVLKLQPLIYEEEKLTKDVVAARGRPVRMNPKRRQRKARSVASAPVVAISL